MDGDDTSKPLRGARRLRRCVNVPELEPLAIVPTVVVGGDSAFYPASSDWPGVNADLRDLRAAIDLSRRLR